jgi:O-antigen/teichoic acid export membrane protein
VGRSGTRVIAVNSVWQLLTFIARACGGLGAVVLIARSGGPESLGAFQFAITFAGMFPFFYGLPSLLAREVARHPEQGREWVEGGILTALVFGVAFTGLFAIGVRVVGASDQTAMAIPLAGAGMAFDGIARVQFAAFWAWERMRLETIATAVQELSFLAVTAAALATGGGVRAALFAFAASRALAAAISWIMLTRHLAGPLIPRARWAFFRGTLRRCTPFATNDTLTLVYMRADSVLLGVFKGPTAVGLYQAGTNLVLSLNVLARSVNHALYPRMSKAWPTGSDDFRRLRDASFRVLGALAMPIAVGSLVLAPEIFRFLYGPRFDRAVLTYQLLVLVIPLRMVGHTLSLALSATDGQGLRTLAVAGTAAANLGLNLYFIPHWSYLGAAITTVISESGLLVAYALLLRHRVGRSQLGRALFIPGIATLPLVGAVLATAGQPLVVPILLGALAYSASLLLIGMVRAPREARYSPRRVLFAMVGGTA